MEHAFDRIVIRQPNKNCNELGLPKRKEARPPIDSDQPRGEWAPKDRGPGQARPGQSFVRAVGKLSVGYRLYPRGLGPLFHAQCARVNGNLPAESFQLAQTIDEITTPPSHTICARSHTSTRTHNEMSWS